MKKQILAGIIALSIIVSGVTVLANETVDKVDDIDDFNIEIRDDDKILDLSNVETYEKEQTLMVPIREVAEGILGLEVKWIQETWSVEVGSGQNWTSITIGENEYFIRKIAPFKLYQAPEVKDGLTYVPVQFFTELLNYRMKSGVPGDDKGRYILSILSGFIKEIIKEDNGYSILVAGDEKTNSKSIDEILFHISEGAILIDENGGDFNVDDFKVGTKVDALVPNMLIESIPPQGIAVKIRVVSTDVYIDEAVFEENENLKYPLIVGLEENMEKEVNKKIEDFVKEISENDLYEDLQLDYEISFLSDEKISILFNGAYKFSESERFLVKSLNLDLKTAEEITFDNYFDKSEETQEKLLGLLENAAMEQREIEFEAEGKEMYFKGSHVVVFYYPLDDSVIYPVRLYLPLEDVQDL